MTWRYQATHRVRNGEDVYEVRETYENLNDDGSPAWTEDSVEPFGDTKEELITCLWRMLADVMQFDVLEIDPDE